MPGSESRMQTTSVRLRDLACDLEQSLTVSFIFDGPGLDLWDTLQLGIPPSPAPRMDVDLTSDKSEEGRPEWMSVKKAKVYVASPSLGACGRRVCRVPPLVRYDCTNFPNVVASDDVDDRVHPI
jgi:hypothetical protein